MKNVSKLVVTAAVIGLVGASGAAYAATSQTPAEIASELTGKSVEELNLERSAGKTYGALAKDAGKLEEFQTQMLEQRKAVLEQRVKEGKLTQAQADELLTAMKNNKAVCDGTGSGMGRNQGMGLGRGKGMGQGQGAGKGPGARNGYGQ